jgi:phosphoribosylformimino-5-aminoimidazole carboxamide ribotide isomerase
MIATNGWQQQSQEDVVDFIAAYGSEGVRYVICTDIAKDGMLEGPSSDLYREIIARTDIQLIASGGITSIDDLHLLQQLGCEGAIIGKAIYEGRIGLRELESFLER